MNKLAIKLITFYQKHISSHTKAHCRFYPTCSEYARQAFLKYNFFKGLYLTVKRLLKCHPFHPGGFDPLP